jgi:hypothetical protein
VAERIGTERVPPGDADPPGPAELSAACVPAEFGGALHDYGRLHRLLRSCARRDPAAAAAQAGTFLALAPVWVSGDAATARRIAGPVAAGARASFGLTRAEVVGPAGGLSAYPTRNGYRVDGKERLAGAVVDPRFVSVLARTSPVPGPRAYSLLLFETRDLRDLSAAADRPAAAAAAAAAGEDAGQAAGEDAGQTVGEDAGQTVVRDFGQGAGQGPRQGTGQGSGQGAGQGFGQGVDRGVVRESVRKADGAVPGVVAFRGARVRADAVVGREGAGIEMLLKADQVAWTVLSAVPLGDAERALRAALRRTAAPADGPPGDRSAGGSVPSWRMRELTESYADVLLGEVLAVVGVRAVHLLTSEMSVTSAVVGLLVPALAAGVLDRLRRVRPERRPGPAGGRAGDRPGRPRADRAGPAEAPADAHPTSAHPTSAHPTSAHPTSAHPVDAPSAEASSTDACPPDVRPTPDTSASDALAGTALCPALLVAQFRPLARDYLFPSGHRPRLARLFVLGRPVPPLDPDRLALLSRYGSAVLGTLPESVARLRELAREKSALSGVAALAGRLLAEAEALHRRMAAAPATAGRTPPGSLADARAYALCFAGAACLGVWLGNGAGGALPADHDPAPGHDSDHAPGHTSDHAPGRAAEALWRDGLWLEACLARVLAHLGVRRPRAADDVLFDRLAEPLITQYEEGSDLFSVLPRPTAQEPSSC